MSVLKSIVSFWVSPKPCLPPCQAQPKRMSKKNSTKSSAGTTVNPAAQPAAPAAPASAAVAGSRPAKAKTTAGPVLGSTDAQAADDGGEQDALAQLANAIEIGSESGEMTLDAALAGGRSKRTKPKTADKTPVEEDESAEDQNSGEETARAESTGEPQDQEDNLSDSSDPKNPDPDSDPHAEAQDPENPDANDPDDAGVEDDDRKWPKSYLRRVNKLTEKIERLEAQQAEVESLREENERLKSAPPAEAVGAAPAAVTNEEQTLAQKIARFEETLDFIEANPDGAKVGEREYSPAELRAERRRYQAALEDARFEMRVARQKRTERAEQLQEHLVTRHPWMKDKASPARAKVEEIIRRYPALRDIPEARVFLADGLAFQNLLNRAAKANGNGNGNGNGHSNGSANGNGHANGNGNRPAPPPPRPAARGPGRPSASPLPVNGRRASLQRTEDAFMETGDFEAGKTLIESRLLADD